MSVDIRDINPAGLYSLAESARLIPSPCGGTVNVRTLQRWLRKGSLPFVRRGPHRFIYGSAILAFLAADQAPAWEGRTPAERKREVEAAETELRRRGVL